MSPTDFNRKGAGYRARMRAELDRKLTLLGSAIEMMHGDGGEGLNAFSDRLGKMIDAAGKDDSSPEDIEAGSVAMFADVGMRYALLTMVEDAMDEQRKDPSA